jgi:hypothetical protein
MQLLHAYVQPLGLHLVTQLDSRRICINAFEQKNLHQEVQPVYAILTYSSNIFSSMHVLFAGGSATHKFTTSKITSTA